VCFVKNEYIIIFLFFFFFLAPEAGAPHPSASKSLSGDAKHAFHDAIKWAGSSRRWQSGGKPIDIHLQHYGDAEPEESLQRFTLKTVFVARCQLAKVLTLFYWQILDIFPVNSISTCLLEKKNYSWFNNCSASHFTYSLDIHCHSCIHSHIVRCLDVQPTQIKHNIVRNMFATQNQAIGFHPQLPQSRMARHGKKKAYVVSFWTSAWHLPNIEGKNDTKPWVAKAWSTELSNKTLPQ